MWLLHFGAICTIHMFTQECSAVSFIDLPGFGYDAKESESGFKDNPPLVSEELNSKESYNNRPHRRNTQFMDSYERAMRRAFPTQQKTTLNFKAVGKRRHWHVSTKSISDAPEPKKQYEDKDENIKKKIHMLVEQTIHDTKAKMKSIEEINAKYKDDSSYRIGFILSMIKKCRDVLYELFNVAVKHKDEWKALEELKIFELMVHTNVDTTNLVRQLVETHLKHTTNSTSSIAESKHYQFFKT